MQIEFTQSEVNCLCRVLCLQNIELEAKYKRLINSDPEACNRFVSLMLEHDALYYRLRGCHIQCMYKPLEERLFGEPRLELV